MKNMKHAFTLTELLIALGIIGAIAAISVPSLMTTINNRILTNQLKSTVTAIQQLAADQMVVHNTKSLLNTDFGDPKDLITDSNFEAVKICETSTQSQSECWKTTATGTAKIQYKLLTGANAGVAGPSYRSAMLKNGAIVGYTQMNGTPYEANDKFIGEFCVDVNGNEPPNMRGRDYFCFLVTNKGKIVDYKQPLTLAQKIAGCKGSGATANYCYGAVVDSGWKMPY